MNLRQTLNQQHEIGSFLTPNDLSNFGNARKSSLRDLIPTVLFSYLEFSVTYFDDQNLIMNFRAFLLNKGLWCKTVEGLDYIIGNIISRKINFLDEIYVNFFEDLKLIFDKLILSRDISEKNVLFHTMKVIAIALGFNIVIFNKNRKKINNQGAENYFYVPIFRRKGNFYVLYPSNPNYLQTIYENAIEKKYKLFTHCGHSFNEPNQASNTNTCRKCNEKLYTAEIKIIYPNQNNQAHKNTYQVKTNKNNFNQKPSHEEIKGVYVKVELNRNQSHGFDRFNKDYTCSNCQRMICLYCSVSNKNYNEVNSKSKRPSGYKCRNCRKDFNKELREYIRKLSDHARNIGMQDNFHQNNYCIENPNQFNNSP